MYVMGVLRGVVVAVALAGCSVVEGGDPEAEVEIAAPEAPMATTYYIDAACSPPADLAEDVAAGFARWQDFGVNVVESDGPAPGAITVCFGSDGHGIRIGSSSWSDQHDHDAIWFRVGDYGPAQYARVAAHEMGHIVTGSPDHLPAGERGIMASTVDYQTDEWSVADVEFIESLGPIYEL